jgi:predicted transcriptional regulator
MEDIDMPEDQQPDLAALTVQLLSAYVGNNAVPSNELADLIRTTKAALAEAPTPAAPPEEEHHPAVTIKASLASRDHIISLIDGKPYKSLKRHLSTRGLSPDEYRTRYKLPSSYPMVAPAYSEQRRQVAKQLGLGRKKAEAPAIAAPVAKKNGRAKAAAVTTPAAKRPRKGSSTAKPKAARVAE